MLFLELTPLVIWGCGKGGEGLLGSFLGPAGGKVVPQGLKPAFILMDLMYGLKPVPFTRRSYTSPADRTLHLKLLPFA
jgi:hypothetical protein